MMRSIPSVELDLRFVATLSGLIRSKEEDEPNYTALIYSKLRVILEKELKPFTSSGSTLLLRINMPLSSTENPANILTKCVRFTSVHNVSNSFSVLDDLCPVSASCYSSECV